MKRIMTICGLVMASCFATTIIPRTVEELTQDSTDVIVGTAGHSQARWNVAHTMIYTVTEFRIQHALKGRGKGTVMITQMGGTLDNIQTKIAGVRQFQDSEHAALFLRPSVDMPGTFVITGMMQGRFTIYPENGKEVVSNGVRGFEVLDRRTHSVREFSGATMTLGQLESRVSKMVQK